jgi:Ca2+-binding EF-hand superfamily protein
VYSSDDTIGHLQSLGIEPTRAFQNLLLQNQSCAEVKFADFTRSLVIYDPRNSNGADAERPAGAKHASQRPAVVNVSEVDAELFPQFKRKNPAVSHASTLVSKAHSPLKTGKKMTLEIDPRTGEVSSKFKSSHAMKETAFNNSCAQQILSHAQLDQQTGVMGEEIAISYNSEQKLVREQVLAALRKLDSGELSLPEFQDKVFDMGFELPEVIVKELRRSAHSGMLNWKKCVEILDAEVFKVHALYDRVLPETVERAKQHLINALNEGGANSLSNLASAFRKMDSNGDGALSFNELKAGFNAYGIDASDEDVRILFNAFDTSGDGMLQVSEFLEGVRGRISPSRLNLIRAAYQRLNRTGTSTVPLDMITNAYNPAFHPDVNSGSSSERVVISEMCVALTAFTEDGTVTQEAFEEYFSNLSVGIDSDAVFAEFMKDSFNINFRKAPPPLQVITA